MTMTTNTGKIAKTTLIALLAIALSFPAMQTATAEPPKTVEDNTVYDYLETKIRGGSWTETRSTSAIDAELNYNVTPLGKSKFDVQIDIKTTPKGTDQTSFDTISYVVTKGKGIGLQDKFVVDFPNGESMTVKKSRDAQPKTTSIQVSSDGITRLGLADGSSTAITPTSYSSGPGWVKLDCNDYLPVAGYADCEQTWANCLFDDYRTTGHANSNLYPVWWQNEYYAEKDFYNYYCIVPYFFDNVKSEMSGGGLYKSKTSTTSSGTHNDYVAYGGYTLTFKTTWNYS